MIFRTSIVPIGAVVLLTGTTAQPLRFSILGDYGDLAMSVKHFAPALTEFVSTTNDPEVAAIIAVGDNFYYDEWKEGEPRYGGVWTVDDPQWKTKWSELYNFELPWYNCLGNHDFMGNVTAQMRFDELQIDPRWHLPNYTYTVSFDSKSNSNTSTSTSASTSSTSLSTLDAVSPPTSKLLAPAPALAATAKQGAVKASSVNVTWIFLETNIFQPDYYDATDLGSGDCNSNCSKQFVGRSEKQQLAWLTDQLESLKNNDDEDQCVFAVGHHYGNNGHTGMLIDLLLTYGVDAYFNGHIHDLSYYTISDGNRTMPAFTSGAAALAPLYPPAPVQWGLQENSDSEASAAPGGSVVKQVWQQEITGWLDLVADNSDGKAMAKATFLDYNLKQLYSQSFTCGGYRVRR